MPTAKIGEQSRLVKMKSTAKMQVYFEMAKEKRRFFIFKISAVFMPVSRINIHVKSPFISKWIGNIQILINLQYITLDIFCHTDS